MSVCNPFSSGYVNTRLHPTPSQRPNESRPQPFLRPNTYQNISPRDRWDLTNQSRVLYGSVSLVAAAIETRARWAFNNGCFIKSKSANKDFAAAQEFGINKVFYRNPNLLDHDMHSTMIEFSINLERDGGQAAIFDGDDDATGYKGSGKILVIPTTLIGNGFGLNDVKDGKLAPLSKSPADLNYWGLGAGGWGTYGGYSYGYQVITDQNSPYFGMRIIDGFIVDENRARKAVRVLGFDKDGNPAYKDYPAEKIRVDFKTTWSDQIGFVPQLATCLMDIVNVQDFGFYIKQKMILAATKALTRTTKDGKAPLGGNVGFTFQNPDGSIGATAPGEQAPAGATKITAYQVNTSGMVELSSDNGEEIKEVTFNSPSVNEENFIERIERAWMWRVMPYDTIYAKRSNKAAAYSQSQQVKMNVWEEQRYGEPFLRWAINSRTAWDMKRGNIPKNNAGADPYNYDIIWPAEYTTNEGYDAKMNLDKLGRNLTTHEKVAGADGETHSEIQAKNGEYVKNLLKLAGEIKTTLPKDTDVTTIQILTMIDNMGAMLNANVTQASPAPSEKEKPGDNPDDKETGEAD